MKRLFFILCFYGFFTEGYTNDGAFYMAGNQLVPINETDISVKKEILYIKKTQEFAEVSVYYEFFNPKDEKEIIVGFEAGIPLGDAGGSPVPDVFILEREILFARRLAEQSANLFACHARLDARKIFFGQYLANGFQFTVRRDVEHVVDHAFWCARIFPGLRSVGIAPFAGGRAHDLAHGFHRGFSGFEPGKVVFIAGGQNQRRQPGKKACCNTHFHERSLCASVRNVPNDTPDAPFVSTGAAFGSMQRGQEAWLRGDVCDMGTMAGERIRECAGGTACLGCMGVDVLSPC